MDDFALARLKMVDSQLRTEAVTDYDILAVMGRVPREVFVPEGQRALAYIDADIPVASSVGQVRYLMEAAPLARLLQLAEIDKDNRVLDVGCGSGYSAAVIAGLAASVVAVESDAALAAEARSNLATLGVTNAKVVSGALESGVRGDAPYDVIFIDGSVELVPTALLDQLADGGRLVAVVGHGRAAVAILHTKSDGKIGKRIAFNADVRPLPGFSKPHAFVF
jgi:protein-L-isoaspartate(D-aspartate) O-methyltransferase